LHDVGRFDSREPTIDDFLKRNALRNHQERFSMVLVLTDEAREVFGYYALAHGSVSRSVGLHRRERHGAPAEIPAIVLGRLGVDRRVQGLGIGSDLLRHAVETALLIAGTTVHGTSLPFAVMAIRALDAERGAFYARHGFRSFDREHPLDLVRRIADLEADRELAGRTRAATEEE
jgi:GNAT superfamily N-acetyltransferase